jgi:uncharacterized protein (DUF39 family)
MKKGKNSQTMVLDFLKQGGHRTAREIGNAVGIADNTVIKDIKFLRDDIEEGRLLGFQIKGEPRNGKNYNEYWIEYQISRAAVESLAAIKECIRIMEDYPLEHSERSRIADQVERAICRIPESHRQIIRDRFGPKWGGRGKRDDIPIAAALIL